MTHNMLKHFDEHVRQVMSSKDVSNFLFINRTDTLARTTLVCFNVTFMTSPLVGRRAKENCDRHRQNVVVSEIIKNLFQHFLRISNGWLKTEVGKWKDFSICSK